MIVAALIRVIRVYKRVLSPLLPRACRFEPTCSVYAVEALSIHGAWRGMGLSVGRLCRCHPWGGHGYDPVPPANPASPAASAVPVPAPAPAQNQAQDPRASSQ